MKWRVWALFFGRCGKVSFEFGLGYFGKGFGRALGGALWDTLGGALWDWTGALWGTLGFCR